MCVRARACVCVCVWVWVYVCMCVSARVCVSVCDLPRLCRPWSMPPHLLLLLPARPCVTASPCLPARPCVWSGYDACVSVRACVSLCACACVCACQCGCLFACMCVCVCVRTRAYGVAQVEERTSARACLIGIYGVKRALVCSAVVSEDQSTILFVPARDESLAHLSRRRVKIPEVANVKAAQSSSEAYRHGRERIAERSLHPLA